MTRHIRTLNIFVALACIALAMISAWPGFLWTAPGISLLIVLAIACIAWLHILAATNLRDSRHFGSVPRGKMTLAPALMCLTFAALHFCVVRRLVFALLEDRFRSSAAVMPASHEQMPVGRWLGVYYVETYAGDPSSGQFFRTRQAGSFDVSSYGFVYRPAGGLTPFGHANYNLVYMCEGWYSFAVTDRL